MTKGNYQSSSARLLALARPLDRYRRRPAKAAAPNGLKWARNHLADINKQRRIFHLCVGATVAVASNVSIMVIMLSPAWTPSLLLIALPACIGVGCVCLKHLGENPIFTLAELVGTLGEQADCLFSFKLVAREQRGSALRYKWAPISSRRSHSHSHSLMKVTTTIMVLLVRRAGGQAGASL